MGALISALAPEPPADLEGAALTPPLPGHGCRVAYKIVPYDAKTDLARPAVLYVAGHLERPRDAERKCRALAGLYGADFCVFAYPDHGRFAHSEENRRLAAGAVLDELAAARPFLYVWGRSMGASVAAHLAAEHELRGVVLEAPLASVHAYSESQLLHAPPEARTVSWYAETMGMYALTSIVDVYSTVESARRGFRGRPATYVVYMERDATVPYEHTRLICDALAASGTPHYERCVQGRDHNDPITEEEYAAAVPIDFFYPPDTVSPAEMRR